MSAADKTERDLERLFEREILETEKIRASLLAVLVGGGPFGLLLLTYLFPVQFRHVFGGVIPRLGILLFALTFAAYEVALLLYIRRLIARNRPLPGYVRYGNAAIETAMPTLGMFLITLNHIHPGFVLVSPIPFIYLVFILLSTLRLEFKLSLFTGITAAAWYGGLATWVLSGSADPALSAVDRAWVNHFGRCMIFIGAGAIAGFVTLQIRKRVLASVESLGERNRVLSIFGQHVSPEVVDKLINQPAGFDTEVRYVCMMFLDIRGFTAYSEKKSPEEVVSFLNSLFDFMIEIVNDITAS